MLDSKARGAQDSNLVNANRGVCVYKQKSSFFCHKMEHKFAQDAFFINTIRKNVSALFPEKGRPAQ
jgi:hypothetical protein